MFGAALAERDDQFDLVVQVLGRLRIRNGRAVGHNRIGRLHEEKRRLAIRIMAHLARVFGVVAADAIDAADREHFVALDDRQHRRLVGNLIM